MTEIYNRDTELAANKRQTDAFIRTHPNRVAITLSRQTMVNDEEGGWVSDTTVVGGQQYVALIATNLQLPIRRSVDGQEIQPEYILIGYPDADITRGDWFWLDGVKYEVVFVNPNRSYEVRAEVAYRG